MLSQLVCLSPRKRLSKQFRVGFRLARDKDCSQSCHASRKGESFCPLCVATFRDLASSQLVRNQSQDKLISSVDNSFPKKHTIHTRPFQFSRSPKIEKKKKNPRENTDSDFVSDVAQFREREREKPFFCCQNLRLFSFLSLSPCFYLKEEIATFTTYTYSECQ